MSLSNNLKFLRKNKNETQKDLAKSLMISFQSISKWEKGEASPSIELLMNIAKHYNVTIDFLLSNNTVNDKKILTIDVSVNTVGNITIWNKDSPFSSFTLLSRKRTNAIRHETASNESSDFVLALDEFGKIIYLANRTGYGAGSPCDRFYHSKDCIDQYKIDCFNILDGYKPFQDETSRENKDYLKYEFIIPHNGMVLISNYRVYDFIVLMENLKRHSLNSGRNALDVSSMKIGEFDQYRFKLVNQSLTVYCNDNDNFLSFDAELTKLWKYTKELENKIDDLQEQINELVDNE